MQNISKVLWHMAYIMANDPARRFTFGVTIEDTNMRLWFCDRSGFVASDVFNYTQV